jgi:hypothetical protein
MSTHQYLVITTFQMFAPITWERDKGWNINGVEFCHVEDVGGPDAQDAIGNWFWNVDDGHLPVGPFPDQAAAEAAAVRACEAFVRFAGGSYRFA